MNFFIDSIAMELYNKIVDITHDELDLEQYEAIDAAIDIACRIIWRYGQYQNDKIIDDIKLLKEKMKKEVEK